MKVTPGIKTVEYTDNGKVKTDRLMTIELTESELTQLEYLVKSAQNLLNTFAAEGELSVPEVINLKEALKDFPVIDKPIEKASKPGQEPVLTKEKK